MGMNMSDLISRAEVVGHFQRLKEASETNGQYNEGFVDGLDFCISFISTLPSAESQWIPFTKRPLTDEEKADFPRHKEILNCPLPDDGQSILVTDGSTVWKDEYYYDFEGCYLDSGCELVTEATAWMPLPKPYKGDKV